MSQPLPKADNAASAEFISAKDKACEGIGAHNVRVTVHMVENGVVLGRGEVEEYCICRDGENYVLSRVFLDPFTDDETGKTYQITRLEPVLWSGSLGALYARYRALLAVK